MSRKKHIESSFSTGGGGFFFERDVQAAFVVLMMTGGYVPFFHGWEIKEIGFQVNNGGFKTDDILVTLRKGEDTRKILGQIKHSAPIIKGKGPFRDAIEDAWKDFNSSSFRKGHDVIVLITGRLSQADWHTIEVLDLARNLPLRFFIDRIDMLPQGQAKKYKAFKAQLEHANGGEVLSDSVIYDFLRNFYILGYDLSLRHSVTEALLKSHISQFNPASADVVWFAVKNFVERQNSSSGVFVKDDIPSEIKSLFPPREESIPKSLLTTLQPTSKRESILSLKIDRENFESLSVLGKLALVGAWNETDKDDLEAIKSKLNLKPDWLTCVKNLLVSNGSFLKLKNGIWSIENREELIKALGDKIFDQDIEEFSELVISVLSDDDPALLEPKETRHWAGIRGIKPKFSSSLRHGISTGLAILQKNKEILTQCSRGKVRSVCTLTIRGLLENANWNRLASLGPLLPTIAEAEPNEFLRNISSLLQDEPEVFTEFTNQEAWDFGGKSYWAELLWALEALAWHEDYFSQVCVILCKLALLDSGGRWENRPISSLTSILLPWMPQTCVGVEERIAAVNAIKNQDSGIARKLILKLLPNGQQMSTGTHKPSWIVSPKDLKSSEGKNSDDDYRKQVIAYIDVALSLIDEEPGYAVQLLPFLRYFPDNFVKDFEQRLEQAMTNAHDEEQELFWQELDKFVCRHRKFEKARWALDPERLSRLEEISQRFEPINPICLYRKFFNFNTSDIEEEGESYEEARKKFLSKQELASSKVYECGVADFFKFIGLVENPKALGFAFGGTLSASSFVGIQFPQLLADSQDKKKTEFLKGFVLRQHCINGYAWLDKLNVDTWSIAQKEFLLILMPFEKRTWVLSESWLKSAVNRYWENIQPDPYGITATELLDAIGKFIEHKRPNSALSCLYFLRLKKDAIVPAKIREEVLMLIISENENDPIWSEVFAQIELLQADATADIANLEGIEWAFLLGGDLQIPPKTLEKHLATDSSFFCEVLERAFFKFKPSEKAQIARRKTYPDIIVQKAFRLLDNWKAVPGMENSVFSQEYFQEWIKEVKEKSEKLGLWKYAQRTIGKALFYAPKDPSGFWIHKSIAKVLDKLESEEMRLGLYLSIVNSRGVHNIDPSGDPEKELAARFRKQAKETEDNAFPMLAKMLKDVADGYIQEAERIIDEYQNQEC